MAKTNMDDALIGAQPSLKNDTPPKTETAAASKTSQWFSKLDAIDLANDRKMMAAIYTIQIFLYRKAANEDAKYALDKEPEIWIEMTNIKNTYNNWSVVVFKITGGVIQIAAGVIGGGGAFTQSAQMWANVSQAVGTSAGLPTAISSILGEKSEANRSVYTFMQQTLQKKQEDRKRSSNEGEQKIQQLLNEERQQEKERSEMIRSISH